MKRCFSITDDGTPETLGNGGYDIPDYLKTTGEETERERKSPYLSLLLGLFVPGLGQIYNGRILRGVVFFLLTVLYIGLILWIILFVDELYVVVVYGVVLLALLGFILFDAFRGARDPRNILVNRWYVCAGIIFFIWWMVVPSVFEYIKREVVEMYVIPGVSMEPTILDGERVFVVKMGYMGRLPRRGDVIVFRPPGDGRKEYIKRVVAIEGDRVEIRNGVMYINGKVHSTVTDTPDPYHHVLAPLRLSEGEVFVLGDNRANSYDSRYFGPVPVENITGRAVRIYYSWSRDGGFRWDRLWNGL